MIIIIIIMTIIIMIFIIIVGSATSLCYDSFCLSIVLLFGSLVGRLVSRFVGQSVIILKSYKSNYILYIHRNMYVERAVGYASCQRYCEHTFFSQYSLESSQNISLNILREIQSSLQDNNEEEEDEEENKEPVVNEPNCLFDSL